MLDTPTLFKTDPRFNPSTELEGVRFSRTRLPLAERVKLATALRDGRVAMIKPTIPQCAAICCVPVASLRKPRKPPADAIGSAWERATPAGREHFLRAHLAAVWEAVDLITRIVVGAPPSIMGRAPLHSGGFADMQRNQDGTEPWKLSPNLRRRPTASARSNAPTSRTSSVPTRSSISKTPTSPRPSSPRSTPMRGCAKFWRATIGAFGGLSAGCAPRSMNEEEEQA